MTNNKPHDNTYWKKIRQERDIERALQGKPIESDTLKAMYALNAYALIWRMIFARELPLSARTRLSMIGALLAGLLTDLWHRLLKREPKISEPSSKPENDDFQF